MVMCGNGVGHTNNSVRQVLPEVLAAESKGPREGLLFRPSRERRFVC